ncbi:MAG: amino acid racemase [Burkholderiales bacterium]|nr:amino acid racemase [Burkholderiales bacterium]
MESIESGDGAALPRIGVLGGMGPLATADFLAKLALATPASRDQDHFPVTVDSTPQIPDRVAAVEGRGPDPLPALAAAARRLEAAGCAFIAMPCNTAHYWHPRLAAATALPVLHIVDAVAAELGTTRRVGLLGTAATMRGDLYQRRAGAAVTWLVPTPEQIDGLVAPGIAAVKAGEIARAGRLLRCAARKLAAGGAETLVLACTEIPLVVRGAEVGVPVIDATAALARRSVEHALALRARRAGDMRVAA